MKIIFTASLLLIALTSWGVSRIGGGKVNSLTSLFELEVPNPFLNLQQYQEVIVAKGPLFIKDGRPAQQFIQIREFAMYYSNLTHENRINTEKYFIERGFSKPNFDNNPCLDAYFFQSNGTAGIVATWGEGKGVTLTGNDTLQVVEAIEDIMKNLILAPGACSWK